MAANSQVSGRFCYRGPSEHAAYRGGSILTIQPPETKVPSRHMESQSMASVGFSKLIPFSEVFAYTEDSNCPLKNE